MRPAPHRTVPANPHPVLTLSLPTPVGRVHLAASDKGVVRIELPGANAEMRLNVWVALHFPNASIRCGVSPILKKATSELGAYFTAGLKSFSVPLHLVGTDFQVDVWQQVERIPFGETCSYGDIASGMDNPKATRAVGAAQGANPVPIIIPCHRVIGADGGLTGYGGGLGVKQWLLDHEAGLDARRAPQPTRSLHLLPAVNRPRRPPSAPRRLHPRH